METDKRLLSTFTLRQLRAGEVSQQLRSQAALPTDPGSIPSTHMGTHKPTPVPWTLDAVFWLPELLQTHETHTNMQEKIHIHTIRDKF